MADKKISQLTGATTPLGGTEEVPLVQSGVTKKVTVANLTVGREVSGTRFSATPTDLTAAVYNRTTNNGGTLFVGRENSAGSAFGAEAYSSLIYSQGDYPLNIYVDAQKSVQMKGSTGNWDVAVLRGNLVIGTAGKGIDFSADPSAAGMTSELLDDYEEGTWTVTRNGFTETLNGGSITSTGTYTKIGRQVFVTAIITPAGGATTLATSGGVSALSGLPYVPAIKSTGSWVNTGSIAAQGGLYVNTDGFMYLTTGWGTSAAAFVFSASYIV